MHIRLALCNGREPSVTNCDTRFSRKWGNSGIHRPVYQGISVQCVTAKRLIPPLHRGPWHRRADTPDRPSEIRSCTNALPTGLDRFWLGQCGRTCCFDSIGADSIGSLRRAGLQGQTRVRCTPKAHGRRRWTHRRANPDGDPLRWNGDGYLTGEVRPTLAERRNALAHGDTFEGLPTGSLLELVRDLITFAYRGYIGEGGEKLGRLR